MKIGNYELVFGIKEFLVISLAFFASLGALSLYASFLSSSGPNYPSLDKLSRFDAIAGAAVLTSSQQFFATQCDIFISTPSRQITYVNTIACEDIDKTTVTKEDLLTFGNEQKGTYTIIIFSEETNEGASFSFSIK
jgi:hypothetical protein